MHHELFFFYYITDEVALYCADDSGSRRSRSGHHYHLYQSKGDEVPWTERDLFRIERDRIVLPLFSLLLYGI